VTIILFIDANSMTTISDILVIEDDPIMREALTDWLQAAGHGVRAAADGSAGLAAVRLAVPAAVVMDIHMPGMSGAALISELKRDYSGVAIIAISGLFNSGRGLDAEAALALGAARALAKPFKRAELLLALTELLGPSAA
jgi:CheY-like chemotaxis protein